MTILCGRLSDRRFVKEQLGDEATTMRYYVLLQIAVGTEVNYYCSVHFVRVPESLNSFAS